MLSGSDFIKCLVSASAHSIRNSRLSQDHSELLRDVSLILGNPRHLDSLRCSLFILLLSR